MTGYKKKCSGRIIPFDFRESQIRELERELELPLGYITRNDPRDCMINPEKVLEKLKVDPRYQEALAKRRAMYEKPRKND